MSNFEYLRNVSIGQYLPLDTPVHRLDPRAKLAGFTVIIIAATLTPQIFGLCIALTAAILLAVLSRIYFGFILRGLIATLPFLLFLAAIQVFITPNAGQSSAVFYFWGISIFPEGLRAAGMLLLRFSALLALLTISTSTSSTLDIIHGLDLLLKPLNRIGIRTDGIVMSVQIMLRFIPFLAISAEKIAKSQASRGAEWGSKKGGLFGKARRLLPFLIPLFSGSLRQAESLAEAMAARGYGSYPDRTVSYDYKFRWQDAAFILLCIVLSVGIFYLEF